MKNKQGKVYGLKFSFGGQSFKASEIGREFGYRSLQKNFETGQKSQGNVSDQAMHKSPEHTETKDEGYQLVPPSRSYSPTTKETPQIAQMVREVADAAISTADDLVEGVGGMITPTTHGEDYAETAWQRKLRNQANRKKKRGRGL